MIRGGLAVTNGVRQFECDFDAIGRIFEYNF